MKVRQGEKPFVPVTITLESQEEVDAVYSILGWTVGGDTSLSTYQWYRELEEFVSDSDRPLILARQVDNGLRLEER